MKKNIIQTKDLNYSYGKTPILHDLNLSVPYHSIYGFLGSNGAGKSTTIKVLLGLLNAGEDTTFLFEKEFSSHKNEILSQTGNAIEAPSFYGHLTAWENLRYLNLLLNVGKSRMEQVLKSVGLWNDRNKRVKNFSMGMKQRLYIATALLNNPKLLILDEPINGLDPNGIYEMREIFKYLHDNEGVTIFLSSHILGEIEKLCSHVGIIEKGRLISQGTITDLLGPATKKVSVYMNNLDTGIKLLLDNGYEAQRNRDDIVDVLINDTRHFSCLLNLLLGNNLEPNIIDIGTTSLEDIYFQLTQQKK